MNNTYILITLPLLASAINSHAQSEKPNLIFIFSDQQSSDMLGCYGNQQIKTPNIDKFASEAVVFDHCISNCPVSTPYRSILLTGQHPLNNGAICNDLRIIEGNGNYFGEVLRDAGYHTGYYGKWHLYGGDRDRPIPAGPYRYGFDDEFVSNNCTMIYDSIRSWYWDQNGNRKLYGDWEWNAQSQQAIDFIKKNGGGDRPIAMFLSWHAPHDWMAGGVREHKYSAPEEYEALYDPETIQLRDNCRDTPQRRLYYQGHMAMISSLDNDFGKIIDALEEQGIADNSIIIFTSDHGDMLESHEWPFNKGCPEIESIKVPLIIKIGDKLKPRHSQLRVGSIDLMPTILGLLNLTVPKSCQGIDLSRDIVRQNDSAIKSVPLFYFAGNWRGVYTHDYTYAFSLKSSQAEAHAVKAGFKNYNVLFDHNNDKFELTNLYYNDDFSKTKSYLHKLSTNWMKKFHDKGIQFNELLPKVMVEEDYNIFLKPHKDKPQGFQGRLRARPVDVQ